MVTLTGCPGSAMKVTCRVKSQVKLCTVGLLICVCILYSFSGAGNFKKTESRPARDDAPIVKFEIVKAGPNYDPLLPWWEQRSQAACTRFLFDEIVVNTTAARGHCGFMAYRAGNNQKVISYTLYGSNPVYWQHLGRILETTKRLYPGWLVRLHTEPSRHQFELCPHLLTQPHLFICDVTNLPQLGDRSHLNPLMWRMLPLDDPQVKMFIARDLDSEPREHYVQLLEREVAAVQQWEGSGRLLHVMRDHPRHGGLAVPGDTWGLHQPASARRQVLNVRDNIFKVPSHGDVLHFYLWALEAYMLSVLQSSVLQHDSYSCSSHAGARPFPTRREGAAYVGNSFLRTGRTDTAAASCPLRCRPQQFSNWTSC